MYFEPSRAPFSPLDLVEAARRQAGFGDPSIEEAVGEAVLLCSGLFEQLGITDSAKIDAAAALAQSALTPTAPGPPTVERILGRLAAAEGVELDLGWTDAYAPGRLGGDYPNDHPGRPPRPRWGWNMPVPLPYYPFILPDAPPPVRTAVSWFVFSGSLMSMVWLSMFAVQLAIAIEAGLQGAAALSAAWGALAEMLGLSAATGALAFGVITLIAMLVALLAAAIAALVTAIGAAANREEETDEEREQRLRNEAAQAFVSDPDTAPPELGGSDVPIPIPVPGVAVPVMADVGVVDMAGLGRPPLTPPLSGGIGDLG